MLLSLSLQISKPVDCIPETPCKPKDSPSNNIEDRDSSSQISVNSQANQLTCHVLSGSVYTSAVLPSALHQATCLNPAHVLVSSVCGHTSPTAVAPTAGDIQLEGASRLSGETGHSVIAVGLTASPVTSNLLMGPGPGPGPGMVLPLTSTSHCMMPSSGKTFILFYVFHVKKQFDVTSGNILQVIFRKVLWDIQISLGQ